MDLKETDILGNSISEHWYYRSKAAAMARLLAGIEPTAILDVGAGSGFFSRYLLEKTLAQRAWCVDISYGEESDTVHNSKPLHFRRSIDRVPADVVLLMDVLEHVDDDVGLLMSHADAVPHGAKFLISVPAFEFLWSGHDVFLEHRRRYRLHQVEDVARRAGLVVRHGSYYFGAVFPLVAAMRLGRRHSARSQLSKHHLLVNYALRALCAAELPIMRFNRLAGLTAFCLAEKT